MTESSLTCVYPDDSRRSRWSTVIPFIAVRDAFLCQFRYCVSIVDNRMCLRRNANIMRITRELCDAISLGSHCTHRMTRPPPLLRLYLAFRRTCIYFINDLSFTTYVHEPETCGSITHNALLPSPTPGSHHWCVCSSRTEAATVCSAPGLTRDLTDESCI